MKKLFIVSILAALSGIVHAEPDARISTEIYDKNRVYNIYTQVGRATLIQFEEDESLVISPSSVLGIGDADDWDLGVRGSSLVVKPWKKKPITNMVIVTNKRSYAFELQPRPELVSGTYIQRFRYLDTEEAKAAAEAAAIAKRVQITAAAKGEKTVVNTDYAWRGENELLKPTGAYDDGRFTRLIYDNAAEMPVFFKVLPDGSEALVNSNVEPDDRRVLVVHEVIRTIRARSNNDVIEIINQGYKPAKFNEYGTSEHGAVRVEKGAQQ